MAPPGPNATEYRSSVSKELHLSDQVIARAAGCHYDFSYSLTLKTRADNTQCAVCTVKLCCELQFPVLSITNYRNQSNGKIHFLKLSASKTLHREH